MCICCLYFLWSFKPISLVTAEDFRQSIKKKNISFIIETKNCDRKTYKINFWLKSWFTTTFHWISYKNISCIFIATVQFSYWAEFYIYKCCGWDLLLFRGIICFSELYPWWPCWWMDRINIYHKIPTTRRWIIQNI